MADYRTDNTDTRIVERRSNTGMTIGIVVLVIVVIVGILFATGFWSASVKNGEMPKVAVQGGALPDVNVKSKEVVVGTSKTTVDVPKVETKKTTIDVPTVGVKDNGNK